MADISDLPMLHDIDADYSPQYVKLARLLRNKIESGQYQRGDVLPAADLAREHGVSVKVAWSALAMLAANRYVTRPGNFRPYGVTWAGRRIMPGRRRRVDRIPADECDVVGANIRTLRQRNGWTQAKLGELMGWRTISTVCAAEGHRSDGQRGFTTGEVERLACIFDVPRWQLTTRCVNCDGHPPAGFFCLSCGATCRSS